MGRAGGVLPPKIPSSAGLVLRGQYLGCSALFSLPLAPLPAQLGP